MTPAERLLARISVATQGDNAAYIEARDLLAAALATERAIGTKIDVERLAEALAFLGEDDILADGSLWKIKEIALNAAAEYARLTPQPGEPSRDE